VSPRVSLRPAGKCEGVGGVPRCGWAKDHTPAGGGFPRGSPFPLCSKKKKKKNILLKEMSSHTSLIRGGIFGSTVWLFRAADKPYIPPRDTVGHTHHMRKSQRASGLCGGLRYWGYGRGVTRGGYAVEQGIRHLTVRPAVARRMPANRPQSARGARWACVWYNPPSDSQRPSMGKRKGRHEAAQFRPTRFPIRYQVRYPLPRSWPFRPPGASVLPPSSRGVPRRPWQACPHSWRKARQAWRSVRSARGP